MDHECTGCGEMWSDNKSVGECPNPDCPHTAYVASFFDEMPEARIDEDYYREEEEDEKESVRHPDYQEANETWDWEDEDV